MSTPFDKRSVSRLTERYDIESKDYLDYWAPVLHPVSCRLLEELPEHNVERALDVGAGVGRLLPAIQRKYREAVVVGVDRSEGMLGLAHRDSPLAVADAMNLGVRTGSFDLVVLAFVLFHLPDPAVGLEEARRILRSGGVLAVTTWADDLESPAVHVWNEELDNHGAVPGESLGRIARHELMDSPKKVLGLFESAGFVSARAETQQFAHQMELDDFIALRKGVGGNRQRLESLDDVTRGRFLESALERLSQLPADDLTLHFTIVLASARCP